MGRLYVFGGDGSGSTLVATPEAYSADTDSWTDLATMPTPRDDVAVAVLNGFIYVIGGRSATSAAVTTVERYDPGTNTWTTVAPLPTALRYQHAGNDPGPALRRGRLPRQRIAGRHQRVLLRPGEQLVEQRPADAVREQPHRNVPRRSTTSSTSSTSAQTTTS